MKKIQLTILSILLFSLCACQSKDTQIAENTFIHNNKIYKVIDNEVREIGDLNSDTIKKFAALKPRQRDFGINKLDFFRIGAYTELVALYRGSNLYYNLKLNGLNDLRTTYSSGGQLTIQFLDEYGFILHSTAIPVTEFTNVVDDNKKTEYFMYSGQTEMSTEINSAIKSYDVTVSLQ